MRNEITAAVLFLVRLIEKSEKFSQDQLECFRENLIQLLTKRFKNHWFPDQPFKGQGYRCIRVNGHNRKDEMLESAANAAGVRYEDLSLPIELTLWVDPDEVCCRFGENRGSYCTLASFDDDKPKSIDDESGSIEDSDVSSEEQETSSEGEKSDATSTSSTDKSSKSESIPDRKNMALMKKMKASPKYQTSRWINQHQHPQLHSPFRYVNAPHPCSRTGPPMAQQPWFNMMQPAFICGPSPPPFLVPRGKRFNLHSMHANHPRHCKIAVKV